MFQKKEELPETDSVGIQLYGLPDREFKIAVIIMLTEDRKLHVKVKVAQSCPTLYGLYSPWNSPGQSTGVGSLSLLQGIFPIQGLNPGLLLYGQILYQLSYEGSPTMHKQNENFKIKKKIIFKVPDRNHDAEEHNNWTKQFTEGVQYLNKSSRRMDQGS